VDGWVAEVFSGIQGEGPWVGCRHLFIRLAGCNLSCAYCDTPVTRQRLAAGRIEEEAGRRNFVLLENPVSPAQLFDLVRKLRPARHQAVSITGGEPLTQPGFLKELLSLLKKTGACTYLETNGTLPGAFAEVKDLIDITAMDFKLASATGQPPLWEDHARFLRLARESSRVFVKAVVAAGTTPVELERVTSVIAAVDPGITLVLQPVTPVNGGRGLDAPAPRQVLAMQDLASGRLKDVRVIPQVHKLMRQM